MYRFVGKLSGCSVDLDSGLKGCGVRQKWKATALDNGSWLPFWGLC